MTGLLEEHRRANRYESGWLFAAIATRVLVLRRRRHRPPLRAERFGICHAY